MRNTNEEYKEKARQRTAKWRAKQDAEFGHLTAVYYIPSVNYAGVAKLSLLDSRIGKHKHYGVDVQGWRVMNIYETREEARHHENLLHSLMGMNGINISS